MINLLEVRNYQGAQIGLALQQVSNGIYIKKIEGLSPVKATMISTSVSTRDGTQYQSSRRESRNIILTLGLAPNYAVEDVGDVRNRVYEYFMTKTEVLLRFYDTKGLIVEITGRIESCDAESFTNDPEAVVSIICFDPDFKEPIPVTLGFGTTDTTAEDLIEYEGTVETGLELILNVDRALSSFTVYHRPPDGSIRTLDFEASLTAGDVLTISTVPGSKGASLLRAGSLSSLLYGISPQSNWLELMRGENYIRVYAVGASIPYTLRYTERYGGL